MMATALEMSIEEAVEKIFTEITYDLVGKEAWNIMTEMIHEEKEQQMEGILSQEEVADLMNEFEPDVIEHEIDADDIASTQGYENRENIMADMLTDYIEGNNDILPIAPDIQFLQASASASSKETENWRQNVAGNRSDAELRSFVRATRNENTVKKTNQIVRKFCEWLENENNERTPLNEIDPHKLNNYVGNYLLEVKKMDGGEFEPDTLTGIHRGIER